VAIVSVYQLFEGRGGSADYAMSRTYTRLYEVYTDNDFDDAVTAGTAPGLLPIMGELHPEDLQAFVSNRDIQQDAADSRRWLVTITYTTQPPAEAANAEAIQPGEAGGQEPGDRPENPLLRAARWRGSFQQREEVLRSAYATDDDGNNVGGSKAVTNSAGIPYDPPVMFDTGDAGFTVQKNYSSLTLPQLADFYQAVNQFAWRGFAPRTVKIVGIDFEASFENAVFFWAVTWSFAVRENGWEKRILDAGLTERFTLEHLPPADPVYQWRTIRDPQTGEPITEPVPLDGNGRRLTPGEPPVFLRFSAYKQRPFATLGF
jgi:hypothetical protein